MNAKTRKALDDDASRPLGEAFNDPRVPCCGRDVADCDCEDDRIGR